MGVGDSHARLASPICVGRAYLRNVWIAFAQSQNRRKIQQDCCSKGFYGERLEDGCYLGVFDGHGNDGHHIAQFLAGNMHKRIKPNMTKEEITYQFSELDKIVHSSWPDGGSTVAFVIVQYDEKKNPSATSIHCGDTRIIILDSKKDISYASLDHCVILNPDERKRVLEEGSKIDLKSGRINGNLNLSRSLGDQLKSISCVPDVQFNIPLSVDSIIAIMCDGVWEKLRLREDRNFDSECKWLVQFLKPILTDREQEQDLGLHCARLIHSLFDLKKTDEADNISMGVIRFSSKQETLPSQPNEVIRFLSDQTKKLYEDTKNLEDEACAYWILYWTEINLFLRQFHIPTGWFRDVPKIDAHYLNLMEGKVIFPYVPKEPYTSYFDVKQTDIHFKTPPKSFSVLPNDDTSQQKKYYLLVDNGEEEKPHALAILVTHVGTDYVKQMNFGDFYVLLYDHATTSWKKLSVPEENKSLHPYFGSWNVSMRDRRAYSYRSQDSVAFPSPSSFTVEVYGMRKIGIFTFKNGVIMLEKEFLGDTQKIQNDYPVGRFLSYNEYIKQTCVTFQEEQKVIFLDSFVPEATITGQVLTCSPDGKTGIRVIMTNEKKLWIEQIHLYDEKIQRHSVEFEEESLLALATSLSLRNTLYLLCSDNGVFIPYEFPLESLQKKKRKEMT